MKTPLVSIVIPTKERPAYLAEALRSVRAQTYDAWEVFIVDNGPSKASGAEIAVLTHGDGRISYRYIGASNHVAARNAGIAEANGDLIALLDDDDVWLDAAKLAIQASYLAAHPDCVLVGSARTDVVDEGGKKLFSYLTPRSDRAIRGTLLRRNCFATSSVAFRADAFRAAGGFRERVAAEDYDLWLRLGTKGAMANLDGCAIAYRERRGSQSDANRLSMYRTILSSVLEHRSAYPHPWLGIAKGVARILDAVALRNLAFRTIEAGRRLRSANP